MDLKRLVTKFVYRIEPKPEGGFIARATDPSVPPLEAATREELRKKIQEKIFAALATEFPGLNLPESSQREFAFHVERTPEGGFSIHSADPKADIIHAASENELQSRLIERALGFAGKHIMPEMAQALLGKDLSGNIKVRVNRTSSVTTALKSQQMSVGVDPNSQLSASDQFTPEASSLQDATITTADMSKITGTIDNSPITPEGSSLRTFFRLLLAFLVIAALIYFFFNRH